MTKVVVSLSIDEELYDALVSQALVEMEKRHRFVSMSRLVTELIRRALGLEEVNR